MNKKFKRILLELSGESRRVAKAMVLTPASSEAYATEIAQMAKSGVEIAIVMGGIFFVG